MRARFWGTRGSIAKAGPSTVRYGGNTSCVEVRSAAGALIVLDCGTGAHGLSRALTEEENSPRRGHILISHTHWDHIQGFPFFAPLRVPGNEWHVYGPRGVGSSLRETLAGQMQYTYFPVTLEELGASVHYHDLVEGCFEVEDVQVTTQYLHHPALTLGYRLETDGVVIVYAADHEPHSRSLAAGAQRPFHGEDERHARFLAGADLLIHDAQYTASEYPSKTGWGHSTVEYVVDLAVSAGVGHLALFHHDPLRDDEAVDQLVASARKRAGRALEVFAAAEGQVVEPAPSLTKKPTVASANAAVATSPPRALHGQSVLVVLQNPTMAAVFGEAIRADGLSLLGAEDADKALALVRHKRPAVVILERALAGDDVLDLCRAIRAEPGAYGKDAVIVLVRKQEDPNEQQIESDAGVSDWLIEPFSTAYARTRVRAWVLRTVCRWERAPLPENEAERIHSLHRLGILDTEAEERFDRYTRIAAALFGVPIALVSLVDTNRQWFKSRQGLETTETHRDMAFCAHAILQDDVLHVPDALQDSRFAENPLVTGDPHIRFYAGVPLTLADGSRAGTLCILDHRPRCLNKSDLSLVRDLGKLVERELEAPS